MYADIDGLMRNNQHRSVIRTIIGGRQQGVKARVCSTGFSRKIALQSIPAEAGTTNAGLLLPHYPIIYLRASLTSSRHRHFSDSIREIFCSS